MINLELFDGHVEVLKKILTALLITKNTEVAEIKELLKILEETPRCE